MSKWTILVSGFSYVYYNNIDKEYIANKLKEEEIRDFLSDKLAPFKIPAVYNFSENKIPRLASEKFDKPALRKIYDK